MSYFFTKSMFQKFQELKRSFYVHGFTRFTLFITWNDKEYEKNKVALNYTSQCKEKLYVKNIRENFNFFVKFSISIWFLHHKWQRNIRQRKCVKLYTTELNSHKLGAFLKHSVILIKSTVNYTHIRQWIFSMHLAIRPTDYSWFRSVRNRSHYHSPLELYISSMQNLYILKYTCILV